MLSSKEGHVESSRVALVVGIGNYKNFGRLDCCPPSAIDVYHLLIDKQFGCCDPDRSILLIGEDQSIVTARRLQDSMEAIAQKISIKDQFIFFFCGHGKVDDKFELTLLMSDSLEQNNIIFQGYDLDQLVKYFGKSINNAIVIIDACHSEAIMKAMQYRQDKNIAFMWSCNAEKTSAQSQKLGKTYFSYYFCKGIKELKNKKIEIDQLVKYINKHAGMNQQADCYAKSDTWVSKGNNFPFINRESELSDIIYKNNEYIRCQIIDAPEGYGKTAVLQKVKKELEDKGVSCFLFKINEKLKKEDQIDSFLKYFIFHAFGSNEKFIGKYDYIVYIANKIKNILEERREYIEHKFIFSLMIDIEDNQCCELVQFISEKFIPDIIRATGYGKEIFFFISGRYISKTIYISDARVASKKISLPAFSYKHVLQIIKAHFAKEKNIDNFPVSDIAAHLFFFSGGHPGGIARILNDCGFNIVQFPDYYFKTNGKGKDILEKYILLIAEDIISSLDNDFKEKIEKSSVFRCYDDVSIKNFFNTQSIIERKKLISIFSTHSFFRIEETTGLFHNEVIRGVVAIYLKKIKLKYFISCCKDAQEICLERIGKVQRSECWVAEYLFQVFQEFSSEYKNIEDSMNIDEFKKNILPEHLSSALNRYINRENKDIENTEVDAFNLIEKINKDEELRFIINYSLCKEGKIYNENSFKEIIQYIRDFFF